MSKKPGSKNAGTKRAALTYKDYTPLRPGDVGYSKTARKYVSKSEGKTIGVGTFQKLAHGGKTYAARKHEKEILKGETTKQYRQQNKGAYKEFISKFVEKENSKRADQGLPPMTRGEARTNSDFKQAYADLKKEGKKLRADKSVGGKMDLALKRLGLRSEEADYPVGETPD